MRSTSTSWVRFTCLAANDQPRSTQHGFPKKCYAYYSLYPSTRKSQNNYCEWAQIDKRMLGVLGVKRNWRSCAHHSTTAWDEYLTGLLKYKILLSLRKFYHLARILPDSFSLWLDYVAYNSQLR